ncbi:membrane protein insertase YidC [Helicobacter sp. MIT 05-5293]|uniref:membrane protein insertase YidC n=1 Tax=Helicobacter sp. MIT 05-5293 TaxID=1548149 RepID=UPI00051CFD1C|nr:membrane protein insertase YidC [Helicobacter sp. MIT 05-5293]TLD81914.1 membrane protein insertase YidC [Helicobacter sp. MIT 05-5293]
MYRPEPDNAISLTRVLVAVGLSIAFFAVYAYFFPQSPKAAETSKEASHQEINAQPTSDILQEDSLQSSNAPQESNVNIHSQAPQPQSNQKSLKQTTLVHLDSDEFEIEIDALGRIKQVYLKDPKFTKEEQTSLFSMVAGVLGFKTNHKETLDKLPLFSNDLLRTMEVRFTDKSINQKAFSTPYTSNVSRIKLDSTPQEIVLTQHLDDIVLKKTLIIYPNLRYDVRIEVNNPNVEYYVSNGMRPTADPDTYAFRGVFTRNAFDGVLTKFEDGDASHDYIVKKANDVRNSSFIASVDRYYTSLFFTSDPKGLFVVMSGDEANNPMPFVRFEGNAEFQAYIGPKEYHELASIDETLTDVVEYGRITFFAKPVFLLLDFLYGICGNWGWAIVLLTLVVRIVLYPLTYKGIVSMQKLKDLAPKMKELQTRYKDDPQKLQIHMMDLYKKHGANPLGGCLPLFLQIPVFFAIYRVLHNAVELKSSEWILWITDLSAIDPYFVLPILMGVSMYVSQRITPSNFTDPMQEKIFKMLPLAFALFFIIFPFPAGLVLYWTVNNIFSIIQQLSINKIMAIKKEKEILAHHQQHHQHHEVKK